MSAHTPGPWRFEPSTEARCPIVIRGTEGGFQVRGTTYERAEADARLIAAAPDGLALAQTFLGFARSGAAFTYPPGSLQALEAFIAKAEAGQ